MPGPVAWLRPKHCTRLYTCAPTALCANCNQAATRPAAGRPAHIPVAVSADIIADGAIVTALSAGVGAIIRSQVGAITAITAITAVVTLVRRPRGPAV
jgi:hypothetical protein